MSGMVCALSNARLSESSLEAQPRFNYITITTMIVFGVEVIINTLGKQGFLACFWEKVFSLSLSLSLSLSFSLPLAVYSLLYSLIYVFCYVLL